MAFIDDDDVERLDRNLRVVDDRPFGAGGRQLEARHLVEIVVDLLAAQRGIEPLDRRDDDRRRFLDMAAGEKLDVVELGEELAGARRLEALKLVLGLGAEILAVDEEEDALGLGGGEEAHHQVAGGEGLAGAGRHLDKGAGIAALERRLQAVDRLDLATAQPGRVDRRQVEETPPQGRALLQALEEAGWAMEGDDVARARLGVAKIAE
jgi:hypothetical protein